jgi:hypothetical protein
MEIKKGLLFKDLPTLRRWLQEYSVKHKRPFKVRHSYVERRYTVVCEKVDCNWRVRAHKQKATGKFKITKIVGPHTFADIDLQLRHRQLTSTLITRKLYSTCRLRRLILCTNFMFKCRDLQVAYAVLLLVVVAGLARRRTCTVLRQDYPTPVQASLHQCNEA